MRSLLQKVENALVFRPGMIRPKSKSKMAAMHRAYVCIETQSYLDFEKLGVWLIRGKHTAIKELAAILLIQKRQVIYGLVVYCHTKPNSSSLRAW